MSAPTSQHARRRLARLLMALGAGGAVVAGVLAVAAARGTGGERPAAAAPRASATPAVGHGTPPGMLAFRPRLAEGSVLAQLSLPGSPRPLTVLEGTPAEPGMLGHDAATAYPGEPHSMLLVAGSGVSPPAPPAGSTLTVATGYGVFHYQVSDNSMVTPGSPMPPEIPGLRLLVALSGGWRMTTAAMVAEDPQTRAVLSEETAVAEAQAALASSAGTVAPAAGQLHWPCSGPITQGFGPTDLGIEFPYVYQGVEYPHFHTGVDLGVPLGTPIGAAADGVVVLAGTNVVDGRPVGYGTYVVVAHGGGLDTLYAHLSRLDVIAGQRVHAGELLGLSGSTGNSTGPHLHFEVRRGSDPVDPMPYMR